ncbi:MAG: XdhC family protein [Opitutaceae bacterium]|nr:XdhC family protein [Opitutaceae bacterium]
MKELSSILVQLSQSDSYPAVLATLVSVEGSSYRRPGARLLVTAQGRRVGSISGGCLEDDLVARVPRVLRTQTPEAVVYDTTSENDLVWGVGLGCHGVVRVLLEPLPAPPDWLAPAVRQVAERKAFQLATVHAGPDPRRWGTFWSETSESDDTVFVEAIPPLLALLIFGAGDDAQPLVRLAKEFGWRVVVIDPRTALATPERFPLADAVVGGPLSTILPTLETDLRTAAVVMTHHYVHDLPVLGALAGKPLAYVGLLGPRKRAQRLLQDLAGQGVSVSAELSGRLHAPVGLDLGGDTPESVALSIVAELQAVLSGRDGRPLRERTQAIHP